MHEYLISLQSAYEPHLYWQFQISDMVLQMQRRDRNTQWNNVQFPHRTATRQWGRACCFMWFWTPPLFLLHQKLERRVYKTRVSLRISTIHSEGGTNRLALENCFTAH